MDVDEDNRLLALLNSVEKEIQQEESEAEVDRENLRRQLFADVDHSLEFENDFVVEREGSDESADEVHHSIHDTDSERSLGDSDEEEAQDEPEERTVDIEVTNENYILGKDNQTKWNTHMDSSNLRGRVRRQNIIRAERIGVRLPSPKGVALGVKSPYEAWKLFFQILS